MINTENNGSHYTSTIEKAIDLRATAWNAWIISMAQGYFGERAGERYTVDIMLRALAAGAAAWQRQPSVIPRSPSSRVQIAKWKRRLEQGLLGTDQVHVDTLARCVQSFCKQNMASFRSCDVLQSFELSIQIPGIRTGAVRAFSNHFPESVILMTLDAYLFEEHALSAAVGI